jgi:hypothetical protein
MVVTVQIPEELERKLIDRARATGQDAGQYVQSVLERNLAGPSLDEVLAPFRDQVERSGMSDDELDALVEQARETRFRERRDQST